jgi:SAM-dependent methyltransferase
MLQSDKTQARDQYDSRGLHLLEDLVAVEKPSVSFQDVIGRYATGDTAVVARPKDELRAVVPKTREKRPDRSPATLDLPTNTDVYFGKNPTTGDERFPLDTDGYDTVINLVHGHPLDHKLTVFQDMTRLCRPGGTLLSATGLKLGESPDHDFNGYVPQSNYATLEAVHVTRHTGHRTPHLISRFTCTLSGTFREYEGDLPQNHQARTDLGTIQE